MTREYLPYYPYEFELDGERVKIHIKRMSYGEFQEFSATSTRLEKTVLEERVFREPDGPEQAKNEDGSYVIPWEELCQRRLQQMSAEERDEIDQATNARLEEQERFLRECIERYVVHVELGLVDVHPDGSKHPVTDGRGLLAITGGRRALHLELYQAIFAENNLDEREKKVLRSQRGFSTSSNEQKKVQDGRKPETTAGSVETEASAGNVAAKRRRKKPSGSGGRKNGRSSRRAAPSLH